MNLSVYDDVYYHTYNYKISFVCMCRSVVTCTSSEKDIQNFNQQTLKRKNN